MRFYRRRSRRKVFTREAATMMLFRICVDLLVNLLTNSLTSLAIDKIV